MSQTMNESHRGVGGVRALAQVAQDVRFGLRSMAKRPGFAAAAIITLALGIGANTAIFSVVYATLLAPLPYRDPDRLVAVWSRVQNYRALVAPAEFSDWQRQSTVFQDLRAWAWGSVSLGTGGPAEQLAAQMATPGFIRTIGHPLLMGRDFLEEEGHVGNDQVLILTHRIWQSKFGGDRGVVGRELRIEGKPYKVIGVLAPGPADYAEADGVYFDIYMPLAFTPAQHNREARSLRVLGRLKPGVSLEQANADMQAVTQRIAEAYPASNKGWSATVEPLQNNALSEHTQTALWLMLGAVGFVLLIACANVANLLLARSTVRQREVAVRTALGASRGRIFAQFLTESLILALIGGLIGVGLAQLLLNTILALMPPFTLPAEADVALHVPVLLVTLGATLLAGVSFGCVPAWQVTRTTLNDALKDAGRAAAGPGRSRLRRGLVVAEFALALTLLAGGGLAISSVVKLTTIDLGFRTDRLLTFILPMPITRLTTPEQITAFYEQFMAQVRAVPGVESASTSTGMPVWGIFVEVPFSIAGQPVSDPSKREFAGFNSVMPDYYRTFGITVARGRAFTDQDTAGRLPVAIVNETFVRRYLPNVDPLTQRIVVDQVAAEGEKPGPPIAWQIVGVHRDVRNGGPRMGGFPQIDVPFAQSPRHRTINAVRTAGDPGRVQKSVAAIVQAMDPDLPMAFVRTMDDMVHASLRGDRFQALLFGSFAGVALLLAALGIYSVLSFSVAQRTREIGLRMALGAGRDQVLRQILREGFRTILVGMVLGTIGAYLVGRAMHGLWFGVGAIDPIAFVSVVTLVLLAALLACLVPARRAASLDPLTALREE